MTISMTGGDCIRLDFCEGSAAWAYRTPNGTRYASAGLEADRAIRELWQVKDGFIKLQPGEQTENGPAKIPDLLPATKRLFDRALKGKVHAN